jgi:hypothetical protein
MPNDNLYSPLPFMAGTIVDGVLGACLVTLPTAIAAGSVGSIVAATALGAVVVYFPYALTKSLLHLALAENAPYLYHGLSIALNLATAFYAGLVGAAILGLAAQPIALCALTGAVVLNTPLMAALILQIVIDILSLSCQAIGSLLSLPFMIMESAGSCAQNVTEDIGYWCTSSNRSQTFFASSEVPPKTDTVYDPSGVPIARAVLIG